MIWKWVLFAPDFRSSEKYYTLVGSMPAVVKLLTHGVESPEIYCIRNAFITIVVNTKLIPYLL